MRIAAEEGVIFRPAGSSAAPREEQNAIIYAEWCTTLHDSTNTARRGRHELFSMRRGAQLFLLKC